jgi:hypothetical protein
MCVKHIAYIDPSATCFNEAQNIAKSAEKKVNAEKRNNGIFMNQYNIGKS